MELPVAIASLLKRPVAILGNGVSGKGVAALLRSHDIAHDIYDRNGDDPVHPNFTEKDARRHDLVVYSPGFPLKHPWLELARRANCTLLGELDFASLFWDGGIVAITGTNGKTTLTEFLTRALKRYGVDAVSAGNIGYPLSRIFELSTTSRTLAVCEVSSFQSERLHHFHPGALLWTNFAEDHLDRYPTMHAYFEAKWNLVERLSRPCLIVGKSVAEWAKRLGYTLPSFTRVVDVESEPGLEGTLFESPPQRENYLLAKSYWAAEGLPLAALEDAARSFVAGKHRLTRVAQIGQVSFWNDSKATNFHATLSAVTTFREPILWIGGGKSKGGDIREFARQLAPSIREAFLIGETAEALKGYFEEFGCPAMTCRNVDEAVYSAFQRVDGPSVILLSPGFASMDMFTNYAERGIAFERAVLSLKKSSPESIEVKCAQSLES